MPKEGNKYWNNLKNHDDASSYAGSLNDRDEVHDEGKLPKIKDKSNNRK